VFTRATHTHTHTHTQTHTPVVRSLAHFLWHSDHWLTAGEKRRRRYERQRAWRVGWQRTVGQGLPESVVRDMRACVFVCMYAYMCVHVCVCVYVCVCVCVSVCVCTLVFVLPAGLA